jgi:hypothetical protein
MVPETLETSNHLTWLIGREDFIRPSRHESLVSGTGSADVREITGFVGLRANNTVTSLLLFSQISPTNTSYNIQAYANLTYRFQRLDANRQVRS